jgi:hypothetical protein
MATSKQVTRTALKLADAAANIATLAASLVSMLNEGAAEAPAAAPKATRTPKAAPAAPVKTAKRATVKPDADEPEVRTLSKKAYLELKARRGRKSAVDKAAMEAYEAAHGIGEAPAAAPVKATRATKVNAAAAAPKAGKKAAAPAPAAKKAGKKVDTKGFSFDDGDDR